MNGRAGSENWSVVERLGQKIFFPICFALLLCIATQCHYLHSPLFCLPLLSHTHPFFCSLFPPLSFSSSPLQLFYARVLALLCHSLLFSLFLSLPQSLQVVRSAPFSSSHVVWMPPPPACLKFSTTTSSLSPQEDFSTPTPVPW